jgi:hypothetical protein
MRRAFSLEDVQAIFADAVSTQSYEDALIIAAEAVRLSHDTCGIC